MPRSENDVILLQLNEYSNRLKQMITGRTFIEYKSLISACFGFINNHEISRKEKASIIREIFINIVRLTFDTTNQGQVTFLRTFRERHQALFPEIIHILKEDMSINQLMDEKNMIDMWFMNTLQ